MWFVSSEVRMQCPFTMTVLLLACPLHRRLRCLLILITYTSGRTPVLFPNGITLFLRTEVFKSEDPQFGVDGGKRSTGSKIGSCVGRLAIFT